MTTHADNDKITVSTEDSGPPTVDRLTIEVASLNAALMRARADFAKLREGYKWVNRDRERLRIERDNAKSVPPMTDPERDAMIADARELRARVEVAEHALIEIINFRPVVRSLDGTAALAAAALAVHRAVKRELSTAICTIEDVRGTAAINRELLDIIGVETKQAAIILAARLGGAK